MAWNSPPNMLYPKERPAVGDDCVGFSWGGGYDYAVRRSERTYRLGQTSTFSSDIGQIRNVNGVANASRGWAFPEFVEFFDSYYYLTQGNFEIKLSKPSYSGGTTKAYFEIAHTYNSRSYGFSLGGTPTAPSPTISVSPNADKWTDFVEVTINK